MGGEKSKTNGEIGEKIVNKLLDLIGWKSTPINETVPCIYPKKHKRQYAKQDRHTHGDDSFYLYESPFFTGQLNHILISSKFTEKAYPAPSSETLNTEFSKHFKDLVETMECYSRSNLKNQNNQDAQYIDYERIYGILFWISEDNESISQSIFPKLSSKYTRDLKYSTIYLIDRARSEFLLKSLEVIKSNYISDSYKSSFYYIDTGNNPSDMNKKYKDNYLPLELLISDIQLFLVEKENEKTLALIVKDEFSIDSIKRLLGLAHNVSKGLAKINIHFPNYSSSKHGNDVQRVKRGFENSNIVDSINILSYNDNIMSLANSNVTSSLPVEKDEEVKLKHSQILPYGYELRELLRHSDISPTEMNKLLRDKGVYLSKPTKENILPILSSILLSPVEFDRLRENQKTKEDQEKRRSDPPIKLTDNVKDEKLITMLPSIDLNKVAKKEFDNYDFHIASLGFEPIDNNHNKVQASYTITKREKNKIWFESENNFNGRVTFELNDNQLEMKSTSIHTSKDTKLINDMIKKEIIKDFRKKSFIDSQTVEKKILIDDFTNQEIIDFFINFTDTKSSKVTFDNIISMDIELDENETLPSEHQIKWMEDHIDNFKFNGKKIEEIELITNIDDRKYIKCWEVVAKYRFNFKAGEGTFHIKFSFHKQGNHEFELQIVPKSMNFDILVENRRSVENYLLDIFDDLKLKKYEKIMASKKLGDA